jgi:hypothetical protein
MGYIRNHLLVSVFLVVMGSSCDLFNNEQNIVSGELIPLAVGNYWVYETTYLDALIDTIHYEVSHKLEVPIGDTSYTAFAANFVPFPEGLEPYYWLRRNGDHGIYKMGGISNTDTLFTNEVEYKLPSEVGETIQTPQISFSYDRFEFYVSDTLNITLIDDNRKIITPAGTFECYVYNFQLDAGDDVLSDFDYYLFYSPGVGLVKQEERGERRQNIITEMTLMEYRIF